MPKRIALNASILRAPRTGIGQYLAELANALAKQDDLQLQFFNGLNWNQQLPDTAMPGYSRLSALIKRWVPAAYPLRRALEQQRFTQGLRKQPAGLYHDPSLCPFEFDGPMVMTLHDLAHVHHPETQPADRIAEIDRHAAKAVQRATRVMVDSEYIAAEAAHYYGFAKDKFVVAPLGCAERFQPREPEDLREPLQQFGLVPGQYLLCVGTLEPRKNLQLALNAHQRLSESLRRQYPLVIVGMAGWLPESYSQQLQQALAAGFARVLGYQPDALLAQIVSGARLLIFPSLYEGFGLPVLEAMSSGVPVVLSRRASLPEVAGGAGSYIDVDDDMGCAQVITQLLEDQQLWQAKRAAGLTRAQQFSWQRCAAVTADVYRQVMVS
ncbi:glycosyltransferase family 1 protein [Pseudomonas sp. M30-35]|uniref:glycosyltransferase family 4 protein n=1 Tax=Pseudomonas sp. M30-35 TaxID=1981174 RepID=UPI000B3C7933|nr:glycosyltransferase family 1 protein [Pseudomonas sp. M30-35]ARU86609.1 glycosyl transferase [Pseudomonas sp. M30-35]